MKQNGKNKLTQQLDKKRIAKIGVISDTHISDQDWKIPIVVQEGLKDADIIIHAGDLVSIKVLDSFKKISPMVIAVSGNMDLVETKNKLSAKEVISVGAYKIGVTHGYGHPGALIELVSKVFEGDGVDVIVFGHSHNPLNERKNGILYFNPGSLTDKMFARYNSYGIIEIGDEIEARIIRI
jgi:putative phosphoesterase